MKYPSLKLPWGWLKNLRGGFLYILLLGIGAIFGYQVGFVPLLETERKVQEEIVLKRKMLTRYQEFIKGGKDIEEGLLQTVQQIEVIQTRLLPGETPQINAANVQEVLKKLAERNGIQIRSFRNVDPKETAYYIKVPVVIEINPTKSMASLAYFLYDIENFEKLLLISDLDIMAPNMRTPSEVQGSLTVTGFTRNPNPPAKGKGKEG